MSNPVAGEHEVSGRLRWFLFTAVGVVVLVPVFLVGYPPILDLAQQMAQLPLLSQALGSHADLYRVDWMGPNKLSYLLLGIGWHLGGARWGPRLALALIMLATLGAIHALSGFFRRPLSATVLASIFVFSCAFYGGFFGFELGAWGLALWLRELSRSGHEESLPRAGLRAFLISGVLYWTHALWLFAAAGILLLFGAVSPESRRPLLPRLAGLVPAGATFAWWNATSAARGEGGILWEVESWRRMADPRQWVLYLLGGVKGGLELTVLSLVAIWALFVVLAAIRAKRMRTGSRLLWTATLAFVCATVALPDLVADTWLFAHRWGPWVGVCLLFALPRPDWVRGRAALLAAFGVLVVFVGVTTLFWIDFDRVTMRGFDVCRRAVREGSSVLSLDFSRTDSHIWVYPTFQMAAYFELDHDVTLNFSFAEHRSSLVQFRRLPREITWTPRLEHYPRRATAEDFRKFDAVLLHIPDWAATQMRGFYPTLAPVTGEAGWWLYRATDSVSAGG